MRTSAPTFVMTSFKVSDETITAAKLAMEEKGFSYTGAAPGTKSLAAVINKNPVFVAGFINGVHRPSEADRHTICDTLGLSAEQTAEYDRPPVRKFAEIPNDPFNYRLIEVLANNGDPIREIIGELFATYSLPGDAPGRGNDGIMSAIDFSFHVFRRSEGNTLPDMTLQEATPQINERVTIVMDGKWLNFKAFVS